MLNVNLIIIWFIIVHKLSWSRSYHNPPTFLYDRVSSSWPYWCFIEYIWLLLRANSLIHWEIWTIEWLKYSLDKSSKYSLQVTKYCQQKIWYSCRLLHSCRWLSCIRWEPSVVWEEPVWSIPSYVRSTSITKIQFSSLTHEPSMLTIKS